MIIKYRVKKELNECLRNLVPSFLDTMNKWLGKVVDIELCYYNPGDDYTLGVYDGVGWNPNWLEHLDGTPVDEEHPYGSFRVKSLNEILRLRSELLFPPDMYKYAGKVIAPNSFDGEYFEIDDGDKDEEWWSFDINWLIPYNRFENVMME